MLEKWERMRKLLDEMSKEACLMAVELSDDKRILAITTAQTLSAHYNLDMLIDKLKREAVK